MKYHRVFRSLGLAVALITSLSVPAADPPSNPSEEKIAATKAFWNEFRSKVTDAPILQPPPLIKEKTPQAFKRLKASLEVAVERSDSLRTELQNFTIETATRPLLSSGSAPQLSPIAKIYQQSLDYENFLGRCNFRLRQIASRVDLITAAFADQIADGVSPTISEHHMNELTDNTDKLAELEKEEQKLRSAWTEVDKRFLTIKPNSSPQASARTSASLATPKSDHEPPRAPVSPKLQAEFDAALKAYKEQRAFEVAAKGFRPVAEAGHPAAQYYYGLCLAEGRGVTKDEKEAAEWWDKAARGGWTEAQLNLAIAYDKGYLGLNRDPSWALYWFTRAAETGGEQEKRWLHLFKMRSTDESLKERKLDPESLRKQYDLK
jgi:TolA-binding protein